MLMQMPHEVTQVSSIKHREFITFFSCISSKDPSGFLAWMLMCEDFSAALKSGEVIWNIKQVLKAVGVSLWSGQQNVT